MCLWLPPETPNRSASFIMAASSSLCAWLKRLQQFSSAETLLGIMHFPQTCPTARQTPSWTRVKVICSGDEKR